LNEDELILVVTWIMTPSVRCRAVVGCLLKKSWMQRKEKQR